MTPKPLLIVVLMFSTLLSGIAQKDAEPKQVANKELPFVAGFEPKQYLGKWYEVARLPVAIQPAETLATAEYSPSKEPGKVVVKNIAYDKEGKVVSTITGEARIVAGDPPGRLMVGFGPVKPDAPNYYVIHVDADYQHAIVGVPDRKSLWILARKVPVPQRSLDELRMLAKEAGFDTSRLILAPWEKLKAAKE
jgi:apolipoprotein D and lipocalin family protein